MTHILLYILLSCRSSNAIQEDADKIIVDADQDGIPAEEDCDDNNADVFPDAVELCNGFDDNCNGFLDDEDPLIQDAEIWYADADGDGFGGQQFTIRACEQPVGYVSNSDDCNDLDILSHPEAEEICDEVDNDCDAAIDEEMLSTWYEDIDADGFGNIDSVAEACAPPVGHVENSSDCNDDDSAINPLGVELCDGQDNDCDGIVDEDDAVDAPTWYADDDGDGFGNLQATYRSCSLPEGHLADSTDCNDGNANVYPGATEYCDNLDSDCDGETNDSDSIDASLWYLDFDNDGFGDITSPHYSCVQPSGYVQDATDCDDIDTNIYPGAPEFCDLTDSDCDGDIAETDSIDASLWYADSDGDGFGDIDVPIYSCSQPVGHVSDFTDCDDTSDLSYPDAPETIDGTDEDCDGIVDDETTIYDDDGDGFSEDEGDCNDADSDIYEGATEQCDDIDSDCDGEIVDEFDDTDLDLVPDCIDDDIDGDGIENILDNCSIDYNPGQYDLDENGAGDACDPKYQCPMSGYTQNVPCFPPFGNGSGCTCECVGQVQDAPTCLHQGNVSGYLACATASVVECTPIVNNECYVYSQSNGSIIGIVGCDTLYP